MLSFGWSEIALVIVVVIIVVGPKEIPNLLRQLGSLSKSLKKASRQFKNSLNDLAEEGDIKEIKNSINSLSEVKKKLDPTNELKEEISSIKETISFKEEIASMKKTVSFTDKEIKDINTKILKDKK